MIALIRLSIIGFVLLGLLYLLLSIYSRSLRREKLEKRWVAEGSPGERADYVRAGLKAYDSSLRRKALVLVFIVPILAVGALLYINNFW